MLLRVCFSLEIRSSTKFSSNYLWRTYLVSLILQRLPCSVSLALFSLSYIGSFYVWQFFYYQISFWIRFPPCLITSVLLCVCSLFLFPSDNSLISRFGFAFVSCFLVLFSCLFFAFLLIFLLSRPPFLSASPLKRYIFSFCLKRTDFSMLRSWFIIRCCHAEGTRLKH